MNLTVATPSCASAKNSRSSRSDVGTGRLLTNAVNGCLAASLRSADVTFLDEAGGAALKGVGGVESWPLEGAGEEEATGTVAAAACLVSTFAGAF